MRDAGLDRWLDAARKIQGDADAAGVGSRDRPPAPFQSDERSIIERFDEAVTSEVLRGASRQLFVDGHHARAVEEAFKCLNNAVKTKSGLTGSDGDNLMRTAFSPQKPKLRLNNLRTTSEKDEQRGYMDLYAGAMAGIRNPRAHEHELQDEPQVALELLVLANHLMRKLSGSTKST